MYPNRHHLSSQENRSQSPNSISSEMYPNRHPLSSQENRSQSRNSKTNRGRRNVGKSSNYRSFTQRDNEYGHDQHRRSLPSHHRFNKTEETPAIMRLQIAAEEANAALEAAKRKEIKRLRQEKVDKEAQAQRFCAFGDSTDSEEDGGAPIYVVGDKRKRHDSKSPSSTHREEEKRGRYSNSKGNVYEFLQNLKQLNPRSFNHTVPEYGRTSPPKYDVFGTMKPKKKDFLNATVLAKNVEYVFCYREPTEISPDVYRIEEVPYDPCNGASVDRSAENDSKNVTYYNDFKAMEIIRQNMFVQSSATTKADVLRYRIREATTVGKKVAYYIQLINLEDERAKELDEAEQLPRRFDITKSKIELIAQGICQCGENVDLRLLEIDILIASGGPESDKVKNAWIKIMSQFPNDLKMWRRHLMYYRNQGVSSYIKDSVLPCLTSLSGVHPKQEGTEEFIIDLIVGAASFYIEMGSTYKAIGILQALIEFYILVPERVKKFDFDKKLKVFELFWDTPVAKAGHAGSLGWHRTTSNVTYTIYNFPQNQLITVKDEEKERDALAITVYSNNMDYCRNNKHESNCEVWSTIEKCRTSSFWEPTYNSKSNPSVYKNYNHFADIKPFLLKLPKEIIKNAVFKILMKFGAVFPDLKDASQESIFQSCKIGLYDKKCEVKYYGMEKFIDNVLNLISGVNEELYLYATVSRLMTCKAFILNNQGYSTFEEAKRKFMNEAGAILEKMIRPPNDSELIILKSCVAQLQREIFLHFSETIPMDFPNADGRCTISNIFDLEISLPHLLASIRYYRILCRDLPHFDAAIYEPNKLTKLKFLIKITFSNEEVDYLSKEIHQKAIKQWENAKLHETAFNLPLGACWIGDINIFALELLSTLCYEAEDDDDQATKFEAFNKYYSANILESNEGLAEIYFKTWNYHLEYFCEEKKAFMDQLQKFIIVFPRNFYLSMMYIANLRHNEFETRCFFLLNQSEDNNDDAVKVLRWIIQIAAEYENICIQKSIIHQKPNYCHFFEILKNAASTCSNSIIPESFLWRSCFFFIEHTKSVEFSNVYRIARDHCSWSKILLLYAASLSTKPEFVKDIEEHAKNVGIKLMTDFDEIVGMQ